MNPTTVRSPEAVPTPVSFSYAQAAKGRTPSTTTPATQPSQTTSGVSTPQKETVATAYTTSASSEKGISGTNGTQETLNGDDNLGELSTMQPQMVSQSRSVSSPTSPSFDTVPAAIVAKENQDDDFIMVGGVSSDLPKERHLQAGNTTERPVEDREGRRSKKSKKQKNAEKEADKEKEEVKQENLVPAPIPTINFWSQRKEEAAKAKPSPLPAQGGSVPEVSTVNEVNTADSKKNAKPTGGDEEKSVTAPLNGVAKELSISNKRRGTDTTNKSKEEQANKRAGPRGSRVNEKEDRSSNNQLPPPVEDAISWPTPETALEEEKRKAQEKSEKEEKDDSSSAKQPRPKEKWVTVPYIPTVTFSTPLPSRGGRGRGGARGGRTEAGGRSGNAGNVVVSGEKATPTSSVAVTGSSVESSDPKDPAARAASLPPNSNRHLEQSNSRTQRKGATSAGADRPKSDSAKNTLGNGMDSRNPIASGPLEPALPGPQDHMVRSNEGKASKQDQLQSNFGDGQSASRSNRQSEQTQRASEAISGRDNSQMSRDRGEARSDRGRGGFRGRGGHSTFSNGQHPPHTFVNGQTSQPPSGYPLRQNSVPSPYSPPLQQVPFSNQYAPPPTRGGRGGSSRSQSIPNRTMYRHFGPNGTPAPQHLAPIQTSNPMFDYSMQAMSAGPFTPYTEGISLFTLVTMQLEYYFSIDNLCKDVYLRKHMDGQGYVHLTFIAGFKRIQSLTQEFELLKHACQESEIIDLVRGSDGVDRLRRKEGWEKWVLAVEERDPLARNPGPEYVLRPFPPQRQQPMQPMMVANHSAMSPPPFSPNGTEQNFRPYVNGAHMPQAVNGNGNTFQLETPLSAAVPDFSPGLLPLLETQDPLEAEVTFNDEEVANLTLVFASPKGTEDPKPKVPFRNSSSRTFSNGSIDGRSIAEEIHDGGRQSRTLNNGSHVSENSPEDVHRSRSPFAPLSPTRSTTSNAPPVMWVKGQRQQEVSEHNTEELYTDFRARALKKRELSARGETHADMKLLYEFWSHFLCRNFNLTMYKEFRKYSFEDLRADASTGKKSLISYYDEVLNSRKKVIPETLARHYVDIVQNEEGDDRPAFDKLRAAWRNGALDLKSRKKIDNLIASKLREELEQAPHSRPSV